MSKSVIVYGPQGCGKTLNADRIKRHFGLVRIVDGGMDLNRGIGVRFEPEGVLYLTNERPTHGNFPDAGRRIYSFGQIVKMIGLTASADAGGQHG